MNERNNTSEKDSSIRPFDQRIADAIAHQNGKTDDALIEDLLEAFEIQIAFIMRGGNVTNQEWWNAKKSFDDFIQSRHIELSRIHDFHVRMQSVEKWIPPQE